MPLPGVSITLTIGPSFIIVLCNSQTRVTPEELDFDLKALLPRTLFPTALLPLPVRPTKTSVLTSLDEDVFAIDSNKFRLQLQGKYIINKNLAIE